MGKFFSLIAPALNNLIWHAGMADPAQGKVEYHCKSGKTQSWLNCWENLQELCCKYDKVSCLQNKQYHYVSHYRSIHF